MAQTPRCPVGLTHFAQPVQLTSRPPVMGKAKARTAAASTGQSLGRTAARSVPEVGSQHAEPGPSPPASASQVPTHLRTPLLERLLDRRLQSATSFASLSSSLDPVGAIGRSDKPEHSQWSESMPSAILFPTDKPSSRADAAVLNQWVTSALERYARKLSTVESTTGGELDLPRAVDELVPILSVGLHEVVRQVTHQCLERGVVLEKIWRTYVELFERALAETRALLRRHKARTKRIQSDLERTQVELTELQQKHPEQIQKLSTTLAGKFTQRQDELDDQLRALKSENAGLQQHLMEHGNHMRSWFPLFECYKNSDFKTKLSQTNPGLPTTVTPEARIAADFKRILEVMPSDGRRRVGFFVSSLLGLRATMLVDGIGTVECLRERKEHNQWKIETLEARLQELSSTGSPVSPTRG